MAELLAGNFLLVRKVGEGGFGTVYEARDRADGRTVAVKVLHATDAQSARRFEREVALLSGIAHPSIVQYLGHGRTSENQAYLAMEWLEGYTLEERLARGALSLRQGLVFARCVVGGLEEAHRLGIVHRDLKPANLFLVRGDVAEVKILDFGLARAGQDSLALTRTGVAIGTPRYMSPEQARGERLIDLASDIFALGSVLYEAVTGVPAFDANHPLAILMMICMGEAPRIESVRPDVPPPLATLVHAMLSKVPAGRPSLTFIAQELDTLLAESRVDVVAATQAVVLHPAGDTLTPNREQRVVSALFLGRGDHTDDEFESALAPLLPSFGARGQRLLDGSRILLVDGHFTAAEQALAAARLALSLRASVRVPMVVCTGRAVLEGRRPLGQLMEEGARLLGEAQGDAIWVDEVSAALLNTRFDLHEQAGRSALVRERLAGEAPRTLLGQVTPFVGRERELTRLLTLCQEALEDRTARVALVVANAGGGKSRLKYELVQRMQTTMPDLRLFSAQCDAIRASTPFSLLASALCTWADFRANDTQVAKQTKLAGSLRRLLAMDRAQFVTPFLGEMMGVPFPDEASSALRDARRDPQTMADRLLACFFEWLEAVAAPGPFAFLVEDLHWADAPSVRFLDGALSVLSERPFVLLAFSRPEVRRAFPSLWADRGVFEVRLPKLNNQACERLLQAIGATGLSVSTQHWMIERAEGNPFFLEELVRGLRGRSTAREGLPDTILGIIQTRLDGLGDGAKWLVQAASVLGQAFQIAPLKALLGEHAERMDLAGWFRLLVEREVLFVRGEASAREYVFRHALIRDAAYALLPDDERKLGHRLAAQWLEQHAPAEPAVLAAHFEIGEVPERAAHWYCMAAAAAFEASSLSEVVRCGELAVRCNVVGEALGKVAACVAEALSYGGASAEAIEWATRSRSHAVLGGPTWWQASQVLAIEHARRGERDQAVAITEAMLERAADGMLTGMAFAALAVIAQNAILIGLGDVASRIFSLLENVAGSQHAGRGMGFFHLATAAAVIGTGPAIRAAQGALVEFEHAGSLKDVAAAQITLGFLLLDAGLLGEAERHVREGMASADKHNSLLDKAMAAQNLALIHLARGHVELAEQTLGQALQIFGRIQVPRAESQTQAYLSRVLLQAGRFEEASAAMATAREVCRFDPGVHTLSLAVAAEIDRQRGQSVSALHSARAAMALVQTHGGGEDQALVHVALVEALLACGHLDEARTSLGEALRWLTGRADTFDEPDWRIAFLTCVPDNARIVALAERLEVRATPRLGSPLLPLTGLGKAGR